MCWPQIWLHWCTRWGGRLLWHVAPCQPWLAIFYPALHQPAWQRAAPKPYSPQARPQHHKHQNMPIRGHATCVQPCCWGNGTLGKGEHGVHWHHGRRSQEAMNSLSTPLRAYAYCTYTSSTATRTVAMSRGTSLSQLRTSSYDPPWTLDANEDEGCNNKSGAAFFCFVQCAVDSLLAASCVHTGLARSDCRRLHTAPILPPGCGL